MPLMKGSSKEAMSKNYRELSRKHRNMKRKQKIAIMLSAAGKSRKKK